MRLQWMNKKFSFVFFVFLVWFSIIFLFARYNVDNPNFWFDESGQFWIAKGLNHYSAPLSAYGGIDQVLTNNAKFNLDPGGFTFILRFWSSISNNYIFLRMLPLTFFVLGMVIISRLSLVWRPGSLLAYFSGFILISSALLSQYAFELRPYGMEMLATVVALYLCYKITDILENRRYAFIAGLVLALLMTSRYSAFFSNISLFVIVFFILVLKNFKKKNIINFIVFVLPTILMSIGIYYFTLIHQNPTATPPSYVKDLMFKYGDIHKILLNDSSFKIMSPFVILLVLFCLSFFVTKLRNKIKKYDLFIIFSLLLNFIFIVLSITGKYPWGINSRWDISTHAIFTISWLPLFFLMIDLLFFACKYHKAISFFSMAVFIAWSADNAFKFKYGLLDVTYNNWKNNEIIAGSKILINVAAFPTVRYLFEYELPRNEKNIELYKNISIFNTAGYKIENSLSSLESIDEYDYIILTHFDYNNSEVKEIISQKPNWVDCTKEEPSKLFKNMRNRSQRCD